MKFLRGWVGIEWKFYGMGGDGRETGWGRVGMKIKFTGTGGYGCNFCPCKSL